MYILKYTLCFIKRENELLMLNRVNAPTMGIWNGVGGKIEKGETIERSVQREIAEETGIQIEMNQLTYKGKVTWHEEDVDFGGMYVFLAEVPSDLQYDTPIKTNEGILDWKKIEWVVNDKNQGVGECIPYFLPILLDDERVHHYSFYYKGNKVVDVVIEEGILI
ncbi:MULTISPECIES: 8-oxo-dGTP diphosphatase [unclassified Bacillus (in: firmicutes)]|uniref:NUDIX hydrolase n=1 Tax=unclassified Bacillus (in: firmicutes) TaxID=185979 RepID=UPI00211D547F|nr:MULTISPECIES: 8-oxo-dGTP diphosphatase [unclassified Bacillus (in: firmicutes)]